jgi:hypothetical protein
MQIITAVSAAIELPLLAALDATAVIPYFAVSRFAQASIAIAVRPIERALPDAVLAAGAEPSAAHGRRRWRGALRYSLGVAIAAGLGLVAYGTPLARTWLGVSPRLPLLIVAGLVVVASTGYRAIAIITVATRRHADVATLALTELSCKVLLAIAIVPHLSATGLALSALGALASAMAVLRLRGLLSARRHDAKHRPIVPGNNAGNTAPVGGNGGTHADRG